MDDAIPQIFRPKNIMECQGYKIEENLVFQDIKTAIILENNGKKSRSKRTKLKNKEFFLDQGDVDLKYCPPVLSARTDVVLCTKKATTRTTV